LPRLMLRAADAACLPLSFRASPTGPRKARPDDRLRMNPESRDSPMCNGTSDVWSFGPSRNDGEINLSKPEKAISRCADRRRSASTPTRCRRSCGSTSSPPG
jgi:hypothetical protein